MSDPTPRVLARSVIEVPGHRIMNRSCSCGWQAPSIFTWDELEQAGEAHRFDVLLEAIADRVERRLRRSYE